DGVAGAVPGDGVVAAAAVDVEDIRAAAGAGGCPGPQVDVHCGRVQGVVERVHAGAATAVNGAGHALAAAEREDVVGGAAGQVLDRGKGEGAHRAGVVSRDLPGAVGVGAGQRVCRGRAAYERRDAAEGA